MKAVNIYALTRIEGPERQAKLERQMSGRSKTLKIKEWETEGLKRLTERLYERNRDIADYSFFYSFNMPKLGKEFDLIRVDEESIVNIELKSGNVSDEAIRRQLLQNRYYLATTGRSIAFYTYVSNDDRLLRLSNSGRLVEAGFDELAETLAKQKECYAGNIEDLFKEEEYLISPLTDPGRFLRREYFLTYQQRDIEKQMLSVISEAKGGICIQGFTGLPGTGKTLLLYDLAMQLSENAAVCVLHFGAHEKELEQLDERLKRIDFYYCDNGTVPEVKRDYRMILVDEGHKINKDTLDRILRLSERLRAGIIISYDREDMMSYEVIKNTGAELIEQLPGFKGYKLTNRIRLNSELSSFISMLMHVSGRAHHRDYPSVRVMYAGNEEETYGFLNMLTKEGYVYIEDVHPKQGEGAMEKTVVSIEATAAQCREFDSVVMLVDEKFEYDADGYLRYRASENEEAVRHLYHGLARAKKRVALIIQGNENVLDTVLYILQG